MNHTQTVAAMYEAFGKGDVATLLSMLDADVDWEYSATDDDIPYYIRRRGHAGAAEFFQSLAGMEFHKFSPVAILEAPGNLVVSVIDLDVTVKATGVRIAIPDEVHLFYFNAAGKVAKFAHRVDTHRFWRALQPGR